MSNNLVLESGIKTKLAPLAIPRANAYGKLDPSWLYVTVVGLVQATQPSNPPPYAIAFWNNGAQIFAWKGTGWVAFA